jgi:DNA-binding XRE family transcriptional regulator
MRRDIDRDVVEYALRIAAASFVGREIEAVEVGLRIRHFRKLRKLSQVMLGLIVHVSRQTIQKYEAGRSVPPATRIPALCAALGVTPNKLFGLSTMKRGSDSLSRVPTRGSAVRCRSDRHGAMYDSQRKG